MLKKTRDFNATECMIWMYKFNPGKIYIYMSENSPQYLVSLAPIYQLKFPEGWYYSEDTKTINKSYSSIMVIMINF